MSRSLFLLTAALLLGLLYLASRGGMAGLEDEVRRSQNYVRGPVLRSPNVGPIEWEVPPADLAIEEGLIEVIVHGLDDIQRENEDSGFRVLLEAFSVSDDGVRHDSMIHPPGTEPHGARSFGWGPGEEWTSTSGTVALAYLSPGAPLHLAVEVVGSPPGGASYSLELAVNPAADHAAPGVIGLARAFLWAILGSGGLLLLVLIWLYFRATSGARA